MTLTLKPALKHPLLGQASVPALMNPQVPGRISMLGQGVILSCLLLPGWSISSSFSPDFVLDPSEAT